MDSHSDDGDRCPICKRAWAEDPCEHLVVYDYTEEAFEWTGKTDPAELQDAVQGLVESLSTGFTEGQVAVVPANLRTPLAQSLEAGEFDASAWTEVVGELITRSPGYLKSTPAESDTRMACGSWTNHWVRDKDDCSRWLDKELQSWIKALARVKKAEEQTWA